MRPFLTLTLLVLLSPGLNADRIAYADSFSKANELRDWTDDSGGFKVSATFVRLDGPRVNMRRQDGLEIAVPIARLSEADKAFLRRRSLDADARPSWPLLFQGPGEGLHGEYFRDMSLDETGLVRADRALDFTWGQHQPPYLGGKPVKESRDGWYQHFVVRCTGLLVARHTERYTLSLEMDDGAALWLDDQLLIHQWKFDGNKEYKAEVDLVAGQPYRLRILYYNSWFGGGIKFRWSSPSQPKEIVPQECLFLPAKKPTEAPVKLLGSLADRVTSQEIPLPSPVKCDPRQNKPTLFLQPLPDAGFQLGWTDIAERIHLTKLDAALQPVGKDAVTPKVDLRGMTVDAGGRTTLLMAETPDRMWLMQVDAANHRLWHKCLVGAQGRGADQHYLDEHFSFTGRLAGAENQVAAHFAHSWNTGKSGVHQGGFFTLVTSDGRVLQEDKWTVSHSMDQRLLFYGNCWFTLSAGDCFPKGLHLQNRTLGFGRVIYPDPGEREAFGNCGGYVNARLGDLVGIGGELATAFITKQDGAQKLILLRLTPDCTVVGQRHLADLPSEEPVQVVKLAPYRDGLLIGWREAEAKTKIGFASLDDQFLTEPESVPYPLPVHDDMLVLPGGDVGWLTATKGESAVRLVRIKVREQEQR